MAKINVQSVSYLLRMQLSAGGPCEQFWHGQGCPLFDVVCPTLPVLATASPTLQDALKDGFREAVVAFDTPKPCKFPKSFGKGESLKMCSSFDSSSFNKSILFNLLFVLIIFCQQFFPT